MNVAACLIPYLGLQDSGVVCLFYAIITAGIDPLLFIHHSDHHCRMFSVLALGVVRGLVSRLSVFVPNVFDSVSDLGSWMSRLALCMLLIQTPGLPAYRVSRVRISIVRDRARCGGLPGKCATRAAGCSSS